MQIEEIMSHTVHFCADHDTLEVAARQMWDHDIGCVPVLDASGELVGIVTDRDICMAAYMRGLPLGRIPVREAMARSLIVCRPEEPIDTVEQRMRTHQIRRLPVVGAHGQLMGMVSLADFVRLRSHACNHLLKPSHSIDMTLAAICQPRGNG